MMEVYFNIGGNVVQVTAPDGVVNYRDGSLAQFEIPAAEPVFRMTVDMSDALPEACGELTFDSSERRVYRNGDAVITHIGSATAPYLWMERRGNTSRVLVKKSAAVGAIHSNTLLLAMEAEHLITENGGLLFHSSFIRYQGQGILFTAPSGTGKSTQADLWHDLREAQILNGDRSVVRKGSGGFEVHGIPFCGSSGICQPARLPLRAIVVLSQAPETSIARISGLRAFRAIWEGCSFHTWNKQDVSRTIQIVTELVEQVPIFYLPCTPDESAVLALESVL